MLTEVVQEAVLNGPPEAEWDLTIYQFEHPVCPVVACVQVEGEAPHYVYLFTNAKPQNDITVDGYAKLVTDWLENKQSYRINGQSVTAVATIPTTASSGFVTAAQTECRPSKGTLVSWPMYGDTQAGWTVRSPRAPFPVTGMGYVMTGREYAHYRENPDLDSVLNGTKAYRSTARKGCYMPLRITNKAWSTDQIMCVFGSETTQPVIDLEKAVDYTILETTENTGFPYFLKRGENSSLVYDLPRSPAVGLIRFSRIPPGSSIRLTSVSIAEFVPQLSDTATCSLAAPPPLPEYWIDRMYPLLVDRMDDAFPASFNDGKELLRKLEAWAKKYLPFVITGLGAAGAIPGGEPFQVAAAMLRPLNQWLQTN